MSNTWHWLNRNSALNSEFFFWKSSTPRILQCQKMQFYGIQITQETVKNKFDYELSNQVIQTVDKTKFLGIVIDQHLTWKSHIEFIASKIPSAIGILCRILFFIYQPLLKMLYNSLIYLYLCYGNVVWANNYPTIFDKLLKLRKHFLPLGRSHCSLLGVKIDYFLITCFCFHLRSKSLPE